MPLFVAAALLGIREAAVYREACAYWLAPPVFLAAARYLWWFNRLRSRQTTAGTASHQWRSQPTADIVAKAERGCIPKPCRTRPCRTRPG